MRFVAIDFETANERRDSACAVGLAVVDQGRIVGVTHRLIRPREMRFNAMNVSIHGICEAHVVNEMEFPAVWKEVSAIVEGQLLVAHNARFDTSVLRGVHMAYGMPDPDFDFLCSMEVSRRVWPGLMSYGLAVVAAHINHHFEHHHAGRDAEAAARVLLAACDTIGAATVSGMMELLRAMPGASSSVGQGRRWRQRINVSSLSAQTDVFDSQHPLFGKRIGFTGGLEAMSRQEAAQIVVNLGGECSDSISGRTDFLVLGALDYANFAAGWRSTKLRRAELLVRNGAPLEIISERDFWLLAEIPC